MIQLQVKAKSGLHAGAVWNLSKSHITVGGSSRADVFLADPGMPDTLVTLSRYGRRYVIEKLDTSAKLITAPDQKVERTIYPSQTITIDFQNIQIDFGLVNINHGLSSKLGDSFQRFSHGILRGLQSFGAKSIIRMLFGIGVLITVIVLFFGHKGVAKIEDNTVVKKKPVAEETETQAAQNETGSPAKTIAPLNTNSPEQAPASATPTGEQGEKPSEKLDNKPSSPPLVSDTE